MAYVTIVSNEISPGAVMDAALLSKIKNNFDSLNEGAGSGVDGAPGPDGTPGLSLAAYIKDQKPAGTQAGGALATTWQTRDLNVLSGDTSFISLSANQFTLQPGTYLIEASAPGYGMQRHQIKLRQISSGTDAIFGSSSLSSLTVQCLTRSELIGELTIASAATFEIQQYHQAEKLINGLGYAVNFGSVEIYTQVKIIKIG